MAHENIAMLISLDLDGMISERERDDLREHVRACVSCSHMWEQMRLMDSHFKVQPEIAPPRDFSLKVMRRVKTYETRKRWTPWLLTALGGLAVAVLVSMALPILVISLELYKPLLTWPIVGTVLGGIARGYALVVELARVGIRDVIRWLSYLTTDPAAMAVAISGLTIAATWIGLLEVFKNTPITEQAQAPQQA